MAALLLLVLLCVLTACNGDDDGGDDPSGSDGPTASGDPEDLLLAMALQEEDLGAVEMVRVGQTFSTNDDAASTDEELQQFETWGRQLGLAVSYTANPQSGGSPTFLGIQSEVTLYGDDRGCRFSYEDAVEIAEAAEPGDVTTLTEVELQTVDAPNVGEAAYWLRISGISSDGTLSITDQVLFRQGNVRGLLRVDSQFLADAPRNSGEGMVLNWAQTMSGHIEDTLAG